MSLPHTWLHPTLRGRGLAAEIYRTVLSQFVLTATHTQSQGSRDLWTRLAGTGSGPNEILLLRMDRLTKRILDVPKNQELADQQLSDPNVWLLLTQRRFLSEKVES